MKKLVLSLLAALCLVFASCVPVHADVQTVAKAPIATSAQVLKATPAVHITKLNPQSFSGKVVTPFYYWLPPEYCYWSGLTQRNYYCYRYGCTYFEKIAWGCYDGYVRIQTVYWA